MKKYRHNSMEELIDKSKGYYDTIMRDMYKPINNRGYLYIEVQNKDDKFNPDLVHRVDGIMYHLPENIGNKLDDYSVPLEDIQYTNIDGKNIFIFPIPGSLKGIDTMNHLATAHHMCHNPEDVLYIVASLDFIHNKVSEEIIRKNGILMTYADARKQCDCFTGNLPFIIPVISTFGGE